MPSVKPKKYQCPNKGKIDMAKPPITILGDRYAKDFVLRHGQKKDKKPSDCNYT